MFIPTPYDAMLIVFGPPIALILIYDLVSHRTHRPKKRWQKFAANGLLTLISDAWAAFVLYVNGLGSSQEGLVYIREVIQRVDAFLPEEVRVFVPGEVLMVLILSLVLLLLLFGP